MIKTATSISSDGQETGALLTQYLQQRGVYDASGPAMVCYGLSTNIRPALNHSCKSDKIRRMQAMEVNGVRLVPWAIGKDAHNLRLPLFARKMRGYGATDLMPVFQRDEIDWRIAAGWDWFSTVVPIRSEMRVWVWRGEVLDAYEKVMERPASYTKMGRNFGQGFEFRLSASTTAIDWHTTTAVNALGLDFGAVDLIIDEQGAPWVLEVNTAPGVIRSGAQATLAKLADRIADWCARDCDTGVQPRQFISKATTDVVEERRYERQRSRS